MLSVYKNITFSFWNLENLSLKIKNNFILTVIQKKKKQKYKLKIFIKCLI